MRQAKLNRHNLHGDLQLEALRASRLLLDPGEVGAVLELIRKDPSGRAVETRRERSRSFVRQFLQILYGYAVGDDRFLYAQMLKATNGAIYAPASSRRSFRCDAAAGETVRGIYVGTGTTPPSIDDYQPQAPIAHGTAAGQLQYSAVAFGAPSNDGATSQFTITRDFANGSGGAVSVTEIGLLVGPSSTSPVFLAIRDVLANPIQILNGQTLTVNYRITAVV